MTKITDHQSQNTTKLLLIGDSGTGKTGALASLAAAGYHLRIIDVDNGLDVLKNYVTDPQSKYVQQAPGCADNVDFVTLTDKMKNINGKLVPVNATVWQSAMKHLIDWPGIGPVANWTAQDILVIDSLSMLSTAALNFHLQMNGFLGKPRTSREVMRDIGVAQNLIRDFLQLIFDASLKCNVILTSHITLVTELGGSPKKEGDEEPDPFSGYPSAIGRALSPHIPRWFNNMLITKTSGMGAGTRRKIYTTPQNVSGAIINSKSTAPMRVASEYSIETGLADYFKALRVSHTQPPTGANVIPLEPRQTPR